MQDWHPTQRSASKTDNRFTMADCLSWFVNDDYLSLNYNVAIQKCI
jgi:hypothetical protein